jgi:hypothetical protein
MNLITKIDHPLSTPPPRRTRLSTSGAGETDEFAAGLISSQAAAIERELAAGSVSVIDLAIEHEGGWDVEQQIPVIEVVRDGVRLVFRKRCPYCRVRHMHGAHSSVHPGVEECPCPRHPDFHTTRGPCLCPLGSADGHRGQHCFEPSSPYHRTGYYLREVKS